MCTFSVALALLIPIARFLCNCQNLKSQPSLQNMVFVRQDGTNMVKLPTGVIRHMTPLETELEAVEGISLQQLEQPVAEVVGRVSVVTPTTASRARFHPGTILPTTVAMFCKSKLARQGVGGGRDLPR